SCFPIAPVAPATNTLISSSLIRGIIYTQYDEMTATAVTPASTQHAKRLPLSTLLACSERRAPARLAMLAQLRGARVAGRPSVARIFAVRGSDRGKTLGRCPSCRGLVRGSPAAAPV